MNRSLATLMVGTITSLCLAVPLIAQVVIEEATPPAAGASAPAPAAGPAQPAQPPAVQPPVQPFAPAAAVQVPYRTFGGGRATAVIAPPNVPGRGGAIMSTPAPVSFTFGAGPGHDDPEAEKLTRSEHELDQQTRELIAKYAETEDNQVREKAKTQLREMLLKQFTLQNQRRELELRRIEERLSKLREQLKRRTDAREQIVDQRLQQLVNEAEGLGWAPPAGGPGADGPFFVPGGSLPQPLRSGGRVAR